MCEGGANCLKYFKRRWNSKDERGNKDFKKAGKLGQGIKALKRGAGTPLQTMLTPSTPKHQMLFFCEQIELRVAPNLLKSISPGGKIFFDFLAF